MNDVPVPFLEHLSELRHRLILCFAVIAVCAGAVYRFVPFILKSLVKPVGQLVFINPTEAFWANLKLALFMGLYISLPFLFFQFWRFIERGLEDREKKHLIPLAAVSYLLFNVGAAFCYFVIVPFGIRFLLSYSQGILTPMISVNSYLSLLTVMVLSFGAVFELPLVFGFLTGIGVVTPAGLRRHRRIAIVGIFIFAAVLTPPDIVTQLSLAIPLLVLYEVGVLVSVKIHAGKTKEKKAS